MVSTQSSSLYLETFVIKTCGQKLVGDLRFVFVLFEERQEMPSLFSHPKHEEGPAVKWSCEQVSSH